MVIYLITRTNLYENTKIKNEEGRDKNNENEQNPNDNHLGGRSLALVGGPLRIRPRRARRPRPPPPRRVWLGLLHR